jgi:hypothetical protein
MSTPPLKKKRKGSYLFYWQIYDFLIHAKEVCREGFVLLFQISAIMLSNGKITELLLRELEGGRGKRINRCDPFYSFRQSSQSSRRSSKKARRSKRPRKRPRKNRSTRPGSERLRDEGRESWRNRSRSFLVPDLYCRPYSGQESGRQYEDTWIGL